MEDYTSHRSDAVKVVRFGLKPQTDAAVASKPPKTDVLRANFYTDAIDPVFVIAICASAIHPLIARSEAHTSELQSLMRISYAVFCLKKNNRTQHKSPTK